MATRKRIAMLPEDREELEAMLSDGLDTADKRAFADQMTAIYRSRESAGSESAYRIFSAMASDGFFRALNQLSRQDSGVFRDNDTGRVLNVPKRGSVPVPAADGAITPIRQAKLWTEMKRYEFTAWVEQQRRLTDSMVFKMRGADRILAAWERYPDAEDARHVCELAGIDPDELDIAA